MEEQRVARHEQPGEVQEMGDVRFMARQPIMDRNLQTRAYELLFRAGANDVLFAAGGLSDVEAATRSTIDLSLLLGTELLTEGLPAFINCTREALLSGIMGRLPKELVVVEILEDVPSDAEVLHEVVQLKRAGYRIALDDIVSPNDRPALVALADIIKVDFLLTNTRQQRLLATRFARPELQLLAEKVETHEQFYSAVNMGYSLFQGYFFCRPTTIQTNDLPIAHVGYLEILRKVYEPELDIPAIAEAIREEPSLCYRLLRYMNSAALGLHPVHSILHALNLLGKNELRKWVSVVAAISLAGPRSTELIRMALTRARVCERIAEHLRVQSTEYFLVGLFSLLDAMLNRPMAQIVQQIPISRACSDALCGVSNPQQRALELSIAGGRGDWKILPELCREVGCTEAQLFFWQAEAQNWVRSMLDSKMTSGAKD